ncbi:MAG TPA: hypothetical protein VFQ63_04320 [Patescibacteria group bacterium]|nr:hypothetical protein [Patescibacteria group bacterium]
MKIILSAHFDLARPVMSIFMDTENLSGLVDNFAGVFAAYQASRNTKTPVHFTNFEELEFDGADAVAQKLSQETIVIVVDTTTDAQEKDAYIGNVYNLDEKLLKEALGNDIYFKEGLYEETEDETWIYGHKYNMKTLYFGIPIAPNYHDTNNKISLEAIDKATKQLEKLISYLQKN